MKHSYFGRKLSRTKNERRHLLAGLARDLLHRGIIKTTLAKAKAVQPLIEKLITQAKKGTENNRRLVLKTLVDRKLTAELFGAVKTRFNNRSSGFTRIVKLGQRRGDAAEEVLLSFVDAPVATQLMPPASTKIKTETIKEVKKVKKIRKITRAKTK